MSSSEGEFESADEDFAVEEKKSAKKEKEESVSVKITSDNKNQIVARKSSSEIQSGLLEAIADVKIDTSAEEHSSREPEIQEKSPEKEDDSKKSNKRSVRKIEKPSREGKPKPMKLGMKLNSPTGPRDPSSKESAPFTVVQAPPEPKIVPQAEPKDPEKQSNDGWDFDDWGDSDAIDSKKDQGEAEDKDGWDRDDWESDDWEKPTKFDTEDSKKSGGENLYSVFPVLSEISQQKPSETEKNSGIFQNLSRMIKTSQASSSYDTFPVLGELGTKQTFSEPPQDEMQKPKEKEEEKLSSVLDKLSNDTSKSQSWGWKPWGGFSTLLSTASEGVATLTHGLSSVIETGMGVPDPADLAKAQKEEAAKRGEGEPDGTVTPSSETSDSSKKSEERSLKFGQLVSGVQQIGNKVISGGLDTLEGIGKKTMTILQENDPGLMNKRKMLGLESERPVLSQILREAKEKTEETERQMKQMHKHLYRKQLHFETLFDDYCGLVHLEALEILSKQCVLKLQSLLAPLTGKALQEMQETIGEVKELCELPEMEADDADGMHTVEELREKFGTAVEDLGIEVDFREILESWQSYTNWLMEKNMKQSREIHDKALHCLAETTALCVCKMHKLAELILVLDHHSTANEADSLVQLTTIFCWHLNGIAARFGDLLSGPGVSVNPDEEADDPNSLITSIFLEGSNSTSYVQNAFQLFIPILQLGAA
ncbi:protein FAM114A2 [Phlebotomus papatasi]|uniref:protein FAM114A2 n=1 Tax=Phlebotomus papatasi TaxID=29031 RepID=UPI002484031E|nr:protein FAM114A2 [Phlebotomus papatasi]